MPGFNQTGPMGQGPMTGRRMGKCTNYGAGRKNAQVSPDTDYPENTPPGEFGFGFGRRRFSFGGGAGWRHRFRGF